MSLSRSHVIKASQVSLAADPWDVGASEPGPAPEREAQAPAAVSRPTLAPHPAPVGLGQQLVAQARQEAADLLRAAEEQANEMLVQAAQKAEEISRQARKEGLATGEAEAGQLLLTSKGIYDEVRHWRDAMLAASEETVLNLVAAVARTILGEGVTLEAEVLQAAFGRALAEARPLGDLRIHVHPDDDALLGPHWPEQQSSHLGQKLELMPDADIRRGGCLVEGQYGSVDARLGTQLHLALDSIYAAATQPGAAPEPAPVAEGAAA
jgi:flagellar assembly protein FliH